MGMWFMMLFCNLLLPAIMLIAGKRFQKNKPGKVNSIVGYRTAMSMKNEDTWRFAHDRAGKFWWKWGWISLPAAVTAMLFLLGKPEDTVAGVGVAIMFALMIPILGVIPHTERALRAAFDQDGNRKTGID